MFSSYMRYESFTKKKKMYPLTSKCKPPTGTHFCTCRDPQPSLHAVILFTINVVPTHICHLRSNFFLSKRV